MYRILHNHKEHLLIIVYFIIYADMILDQTK